MNILDTSDQSFHPASETKTKQDVWNWASDSQPGEFALVPKTELKIDGTYQRKVSERKVRDIAKNWDWKLIGAICVIVRKDGTLWVYDGGNRTCAAFRRKDVTVLPCMIFKADSLADEAKAFIGCNNMRSNATPYQKHIAALAAKEPAALRVQDVLETYGYKPCGDAGRRYGYVALAALYKILETDPELAADAFGVCAYIAEDGEPFSGELLQGVFLCARYLQGTADIFKDPHLAKLATAGIKGINAAIAREGQIVGKGGPRVSAGAILALLNKGKRNRLAFN